MKRPTYSVVIPTLNEEKFLPSLLQSLVRQTKKSFEVIVVDGKSKDKTVTIAKSYQEKILGLSVIVSKKASLPLQRNLGARHSHGEWLVFIDADSVLSAYFIEEISAYIDRVKPKLFTTWFQPDVDNSNAAVYVLIANILLEWSIQFHRPLAPGPLTIVHRSAYDLVRGYDEEHAFQEDMDFSLRLYKAGMPLHILRETLCVLSLRRLRQQGAFKVLAQYVRATIPVLVFSKTYKKLQGYRMGGHLYRADKKPIKQSMLRRYERKIKRLIKELFE